MNYSKTHASIKNIQTKPNIKNIQSKPQNLDNACQPSVEAHGVQPLHCQGHLMVTNADFVHFFLLSARGVQLWDTYSQRHQGKQSQSFSSPNYQDSDNF